MKRERLVYSEAYQKPGLSIMVSAFPKFKHTNGLQPERMYILAVGVVEKNGVTREYQDIRVYFKSPGSTGRKARAE